MSLREIEIPSIKEDAYNKFNEWIINIGALAMRVEGFYEIDHYDQLALRQELLDYPALELPKGTEFLLSGEGYRPVLDRIGDWQTIYTSMAFIRGTNPVLSFDPAMSFEDVASLEDVEDDEHNGEGPVAIERADDNGALQHIFSADILEQMRPMPDEPRVLIEFDVGVTQRDEIEIAGPCVTTRSLSFKVMIDALLMELIDIEPPMPETVGLDILPVVAREYSAKARKLKGDTSFRRSSKGAQKKLLEDLVADANNVLKINRFSGFVNITDSVYQHEHEEDTEPAYVYATSLANENRAEKKVLLPDYICFEFTPQSVDCLEAYMVAEDQTIRNNNDLINTDSGLCIVARVSVDVALELGLEDTDVIRIPIEKFCREINLSEAPYLGQYNDAAIV